MQSRSYQTTSLDEGLHILGREWSRHHIGVSDGGRLHLRLSIRSVTPDVSLSSLSYGARVMIRPEERADVILLQMPRSGIGQASHASINTRLDASHYGLIDVKHVALVHCSTDYDALVLRIRKARLMDFVAQTLGREPDHELVFEPGIAAGTPAWTAWAPVAAALESMARQPDADYPDIAMTGLESMILSTLLLTQPNSYREALLRPPKAIAPRHVRRAEAFIHANLDRVVTTEEMAQQAGVSIRALFDGFRHFRGVTPSLYARNARLDAARADLLAGAEGVATVARRWGFQHTGHFAAHYQRRFGQAPGRTQRASAEPAIHPSFNHPAHRLQ